MEFRTQEMPRTKAPKGKQVALGPQGGVKDCGEVGEVADIQLI